MPYGNRPVPSFGRPSLAQDLLEEFRAGAVDRLVLKLVNRRTLREEHFEAREEGGVGLTKPGWRRFIGGYEQHLDREFARNGRAVSLRRCFVMQARALVHAVEDGTAYQGYQER